MKIIYDDIIYSLQNKGGISNYWYNLKQNLPHSLDITSINGFSKKESLLPINILRYLDCDLKFSSKFIFHSSYYRVSKNKNAINVVTVYDFIYEKFRSGLSKKLHMFQKARAINKADHIICISHSTKDDLIKFYPSVSPEKISVIYLGASNVFYKDKNENLNKNLLFVGSRKGYKNFNVIVDAIKNLPDYVLNIVGGGKLSKKEIIELGNTKYKHFLDCDNEKLNKLYNNSYALIYPSLYEGFGLPIIESLKAGCPVICNDGSSTNEIGSQYVLKGIMKKNFIVESLEKLQDKKYRQKLIFEGIKYASNFTWKSTANETFERYKKLWVEFH